MRMWNVGVTLYEYEVEALLYTNMNHMRFFIRLWSMCITLYECESWAFSLYEFDARVLLFMQSLRE